MLFRSGIKMNYSHENRLLGTAGGVKNNSHFLNDTFFVLSGDALTDIDLTKMLKFHKSNNSVATIAVKDVKNVSLYGIVVTDSSGRINAFQEKPFAKEALSNIANTGIYLFEPEIFDYIPDGFYDFGSQLFPKLLGLGVNLFAFKTKDYWCDIGEIEAYKQAHRDISTHPTLREFALSDGCYELKETCFAGINTSLNLNLNLGKNVFIGRNCKIGCNVELNNCIIWDNSTIEDNVVIDDAIIGSNCLIQMNTNIREGTLLGSNTVIQPNNVVLTR